MKKLKSSLIATAVLVGGLAFGVQAQAEPITGMLSLGGTDSFTTNSITFTGPGNIGQNTTTGSFTELGGCTGCVTLSNFTSSSTNFLVYTATNNSNTTTLTLNSATFNFVPGSPFDSLTITGSGTATLTGFDPTPGDFILTTQGATGQTATGNFTFSATTLATAVPEPSSLMLLGTGLAALGLFGFLRRRDA